MAARLLLHASGLAFTHPLSQQALQFTSPADF
jgi:23S rRNA-/tRNA-specific pseudouridylate synthase